MLFLLYRYLISATHLWPSALNEVGLGCVHQSSPSTGCSQFSAGWNQLRVKPHPFPLSNGNKIKQLDYFMYNSPNDKGNDTKYSFCKNKYETKTKTLILGTFSSADPVYCIPSI